MNICVIGRSFLHAYVKDVVFESSRTILEFDAAFVDAAGLMNHSQNGSAINFRRSEFYEFLALGRTIVVFVAPVRLESFLPIQPVNLISISGDRLEFKGADFLKNFWQAVQSDMQFQAYFGNCPGQPFLFVPSTKKAVATLARQDGGHILFLPWFEFPAGAVGPHAYQQSCARFVTAFEKLNEHLVPSKAKVALPAWSKGYEWPRERELSENLQSLQDQSNSILQKITATTNELEVEDKLKVLFTGTGDALSETVITALRELGVKAQPGPPGRDDIIMEFDGKHAVVEVKGKKGSAAEADAAQLEKWVAGIKEEKGVEAKGLLIVNAYCDTPLAERTNPAFPHQMLKYSTQREHCLMTTTQLLGLLLEGRTNPQKKADLVNSMFSTIGVYQNFSDWKTFLIAPALPVQPTSK